MRRTLPLCLSLLALPLFAAQQQPASANGAATNDAIHSVTPKSKLTILGKDAKGRALSMTIQQLDESGFNTNIKGETSRHKWSEFDAKTIKKSIGAAIDAKNAESLLFQARLLLHAQTGGRALAMEQVKAAAQLKKLSPEQARQLESQTWDAYAKDYNAGKPKWAWDKLTMDEETKCLAALDAKAKDIMTSIGIPKDRCLSDQSDHFIFYTDTNMATARRWGQKMEASYAALCGVFAIDPTDKIWTGKCLIAILSTESLYHAFNAKLGINSQGSAGLNVSNAFFFGSNSVQFFDDPRNPAYTNIVLDHELSHAFTSHFHGNDHLVSWANEGLAEYVSNLTAPKANQTHEQKASEGAQHVKQVKSLENFFTARNIIGPHYGVAFTMTDMMIKQNGPSYAEFICACTEGMDPKEALRTHLGLSYEQLANAYGQSIGAKDLRP